MIFFVGGYYRLLGISKKPPFPPLKILRKQAKLIGNDTMAGDKFGVSVGISESYAVVPWNVRKNWRSHHF